MYLGSSLYGEGYPLDLRTAADSTVGIVSLKIPTAKSVGGASRVRSWRRCLSAYRRRMATFTAAVLTVGVGYHVIFGHNGLTAYQQKRENTFVLEQQLRTLTQENRELKGHVDRLQSDPSSIEHQAREELHYTRPGEVIVTLPGEVERVAGVKR